MPTLEVQAITNGKQTDSSDIQRALSQAGDDEDHDTVHFAAGIYNINDPGVRNSHAVIEINPRTTIIGDVDQNGKPTTIFRLMDNAPVKPFGCSVPILGPDSSVGSDIHILNLKFDGNCEIGTSKQNYFSSVSCSGTMGKPGMAYGKGYSNLLGALYSSFCDCSFENITIINSAGEGFRTNFLRNQTNYRSSNLTFKNWDISFCGHTGLMFENAENVLIQDVNIISRVNGGIRLQNGCSNINIQNVNVTGTSYDYNPGMQIGGRNINISNCKVHNTMGPGIEVSNNEDPNENNVVIDSCELIDCGGFATTTAYNVAGILWNGCSGIIKNCRFEGCYQQSISANVYQPDGSSFSRSGYVIQTIDNVIIDTLKSKFSVPSNGRDIGNLLPGSHRVTSLRNTFYPFNHTGNVDFLD